MPKRGKAELRMLEQLETGLEHLKDKANELDFWIRESDGEARDAYRHEVRALRVLMTNVSVTIREEYPEAMDRQAARLSSTGRMVRLTPELTPSVAFFAPR
jgi:hypothetical protein